MKKSIIIISTIFLSLLTGGCGKPPVKDIQTAEQALDEARKAEAERFAPKKFKASEATFSEAKTEIEKENKKLLGKNYLKASDLLKETVTLAQEAIKETEQLKAKTAVEATKADAETAVNRVYSYYKKARKAKGNATVLSRAMDLLKQAQSAMKQGNYKNAVDLAEQANTELETL